jgi:hypothetical protein
VADAATARSLVDTGEREVAACEDFRALAAEGTLAASALAFAPTAAGVDVDVYWPLRAPGVLDAAFATQDDGLVDLAAATGVKLLALVPLAGTAGLRKLPRPGALVHDRRAIEERARLCGGAASAQLFLVGWPQYLAVLLDSDAGTNEAFQGMRNLAYAVRSYGETAEPQMVMTASFDKPVLSDDLDRVLKRGSTQAGQRKLTTWKSDRPGEPWAVAAAGLAGRTIYGLVWGGTPVVAWWWGQPSPPSPGGTTPFVALARTELPWLFEKLLERELAVPGLGELAQGLGGLKALLTLEPESLHLHATVGVR